MLIDKRHSAYVKTPLPEFLTNWAQQANIKLLPSDKGADYELIYEHRQLQLNWLGEQNFSPLMAQMPKLRRVEASNLLFKAIGKKTRHVTDLTAGLGVDAFTLAAHGKVVDCVERCAPIALLLFDAISRNSGSITDNIHLNFADSRQWLQKVKVPLETIYIDTMFMAKKKTAKSNKSMQIIRAIAGDDMDAGLLVNRALASGAKRVVIKHPDNGSMLGPEPSFQYQGKTVRFDIYISPK